MGDDQDEVDEVARLLRATAAAGGRYHEVAAVAPSVQRADELARGLRALGFPVARSLPATEGGSARLTNLLETAFPAAGEAWGRAAVIAHATGLAVAGALPEADVARWAEESRQAGVVAGDDWGRLARLQRWLAAMLGDLSAGREDDEAPSSAGRAASLQRRLDAVTGLAAFVQRLRSAVADLPAVARRRRWSPGSSRWRPTSVPSRPTIPPSAPWASWRAAAWWNLRSGRRRPPV